MNLVILKVISSVNLYVDTRFVSVQFHKLNRINNASLLITQTNKWYKHWAFFVLLCVV